MTPDEFDDPDVIHRWALSTTCPVCQQGPGQQCRTQSPLPKMLPFSHMTRYRLVVSSPAYLFPIIIEGL